MADRGWREGQQLGNYRLTSIPYSHCWPRCAVKDS
jgi:hypothetical protein